VTLLADDVPAAHSMDSAWFAVDACGHVAAGETGEAGALPEPLQQGVYWPGYDELRRVVPPGGFVLDARGQGAGLPTTRVHRTWGEQPQQALVFAEADVLAPLLLRHGGRLLQAVGGAAAVVEGLRASDLEELHARGLCRACRWTYGDRLTRGARRPAALGLFEYDHDLYENVLAGPYGLVRPRHPIKVAQLPEALRREVEQVRFEGLCFADHPLLQPADHVPCATWSAPYLSADARTIRTQRPEGLSPEERAHLEPGAVHDPSPWRPLHERGAP